MDVHFTTYEGSIPDAIVRQFDCDATGDVVKGDRILFPEVIVRRRRGGAYEYLGTRWIIADVIEDRISMRTRRHMLGLEVVRVGGYWADEIMRVTANGVRPLYRSAGHVYRYRTARKFWKDEWQRELALQQLITRAETLPVAEQAGVAQPRRRGAPVDTARPDPGRQRSGRS